MDAADNACMNIMGLAALAILGSSITLLTGCSPALNWRTVQLDNAPLQLALPCKPQAQTRPVALESGSVQMSMVGCEADGRTFAVMHFLLTDPTRAGEVLGHWQKAALAQARVDEAADTRSVVTDTQWIPKEALNLPQAQHIVFRGTSSQGHKLMGDGLWFARMEGASARLFHVVIYGNTDPKVVEMFFPSLKLQ